VAVRDRGAPLAGKVRYSFGAELIGMASRGPSGYYDGRCESREWVAPECRVRA
jgi:hypothetical protein